MAARTAITVQSIRRNTGATLEEIAADSANGMQFNNDGQTLFHVVNGGGASITVTLRSVPCSHGRTQDLELTVAAGDSALAGPFPVDTWNQGGAVLVDLSGSTSVTVAAVSQVG